MGPRGRLAVGMGGINAEGALSLASTDTCRAAETPVKWTDLPQTATSVDFRTVRMSRRRLLINVSQFALLIAGRAGASPLVGSCLNPQEAQPWSDSTLWSGGAGWVK